MKLRYITIITVAALLCVADVNAQTNKPAAKAAAKRAAAKAKTIPADKKAANLAKSLPAIIDTTKRGGNKMPAAPNPNNGGLSEEIVVTTAYKPVLAEAVKIRRNPDLEDQQPFKAPLSYINVMDKTLQLNTDIRQFDAMKMPREQSAEVFNNYAKLGGGNIKTTYGEVYINNGADPGLQLGGFVKHLAQAGSLYQQNYSKEEAGIFGKSIGESSSISGRLNYSLRNNYFYGYDGTQLPPAGLNVAKQHFSTLSGEAEIAKNTTQEEKQFIYAAKLSGYTFSNAYLANENNIAISGYINQTIGNFYAGLNGSIDLTTVKDSLYNISNNLIRATPYIKLEGENYKIDAGIKIVSLLGYKSEFNIFPAAQLEFQIVPKYLRLFAEAGGDVNRSSIREFSEINPFLGKNISIQNSIDQLDLTVGLKGMLAPGLGFKASIYRNSVKDMPLFVSNFNATQTYNRFTVIYDNGKSRVSGFNGELDYKASDDFDIFGKVEFKDYQLATEVQPWNLPKFKLTAGTTIHINKQININGSLAFRGAAYDRTGPTNQIVNISSFADISGGGEYKINNKFSVFLQVNNLLGNDSQTWLYYPNYGFNIFGGVGYKF
ncbi:hypothetical protein ACFGVR_22585 [Mucilaginibacter sp. AW1-3]